VLGRSIGITSSSKTSWNEPRITPNLTDLFVVRLVVIRCLSVELSPNPEIRYTFLAEVEGSNR
jgi:hypothetical protein